MENKWIWLVRTTGRMIFVFSIDNLSNFLFHSVLTKSLWYWRSSQKTSRHFSIVDLIIETFDMWMVRFDFVQQGFIEFIWNEFHWYQWRLLLVSQYFWIENWQWTDLCWYARPSPPPHRPLPWKSWSVFLFQKHSKHNSAHWCYDRVPSPINGFTSRESCFSRRKASSEVKM